MVNPEYAANSLVLRQLLSEVRDDATLPADIKRDHRAMLKIVAERMQSRYSFVTHRFLITPRNSVHVSLEALGAEGTFARIVTTHFGDTSSVAKEPRARNLWPVEIDLQPA